MNFLHLTIVVLCTISVAWAQGVSVPGLPGTSLFLLLQGLLSYLGPLGSILSPVVTILYPIVYPVFLLVKTILQAIGIPVPLY